MLMYCDLWPKSSKIVQQIAHDFTVFDSNSLPASKQVSRDDFTHFTDFDIPRAKKPDKTICLTTNDSQDKNAECIFPWKYIGKIRNECTNEKDPNGK